MSFGEILMWALLIIPIGTLGILFLVTLTALVVSAIHDVLDAAKVPHEWFWGTLTVILFAAFFVWFVLGSPGVEPRSVPRPVEGREEWIDLREGTTYSQVERRTDD